MNKTNLTIHSLRKQGYKVRACIKRFSKTDYLTVSQKRLQKNPNDFLFLQKDLVGALRAPKGGYYGVEITTPEGKELRGEAYCSPRDPFNRKLGMTISLNRAFNSQN